MPKVICYKAKQRARNRKWAYEYLLEHPCVDCGEDNPILLDFDHIGDKTSRVSKMLLTNSLEVIQLEIAKCQVRCVACHRLKTSIDQGWYSAKRFFNLP